MSDNLVELSSLSSENLVKKLGMKVFVSVVVDILMGGNVRDFTEILTRKRLVKSYCEILLFFHEANKAIYRERKVKSSCQIMYLAQKELINGNIPKRYVPIYNWLVGSTSKQIDNVLRGNFSDIFSSLLKKTHQEIADTVKYNIDFKYNHYIDFKYNRYIDLLYFSLVCGSATLTIRGSEKSLHGKYFEKLILGCIFQICGFKLVEKIDYHDSRPIFVLSSQDKNTRESDATLYYNNLIIKVDIGFIGKGNPEITNDKISRYAREIEGDGKQINSKTIVIIDTLSQQSGLYNFAKKINASIFCMSNKNWFIELTKELFNYFNMNNVIESIHYSKIKIFLEKRIKQLDVSIEELIKGKNL